MPRITAMAASGNGTGDAVFVAIEDESGRVAVIACYVSNAKISEWTQLPQIPELDETGAK